MARTPYDRAVEAALEELALETGGSPDKYRYLVVWLSQRIDFRKVDSQTTLLRWLDRIIDEESTRLRIPRKDYEKRFKGLIKFITDPHLAWRGLIVPYQNRYTEEFITELTELAARAKTLDEYRDLLEEAKSFTPPPAVEPIYANRLKQIRLQLEQIVQLLTRAKRLADKYISIDLSKMRERDIFRAYRNIQKVRRYIQARVTALDVIHALKDAEERLISEYRRRSREYVRRLLERRLARST